MRKKLYLRRQNDGGDSMKICCDICGGELEMTVDGQSAVCKDCGMRHSVERVRQMLKKPAQASASKEHHCEVDTKPKSKARSGGMQPTHQLTESKESDFVVKKRFGGVKLLEYRGNAQRVTVPADIDEIPGPQFFAGHDEIVELIFPGGLSTPYSGCFANCRNLRKVTIMDSVVLMDETFANCPALETVEIVDVALDAPLIIGNRAFANCAALRSFTVDPNGKLELGEYTFEGCSALMVFHHTQYTGLYSGDAEIPEGCFKNCVQLQEVVVADDLQTICDKAFENCGMLKRVTYHDGTVPSGVVIQPGAFRNAGCKI